MRRPGQQTLWVPALAAAEPDPIFAAIEKMKVTDAEHGVTVTPQRSHKS